MALPFAFKESGFKELINKLDKTIASIEQTRRKGNEAAARIATEESKRLAPEQIEQSIRSEVNRNGFELISDHPDAIRQHEDTSIGTSSAIKGSKFFKRAVENRLEKIIQSFVDIYQIAIGGLER